MSCLSDSVLPLKLAAGLMLAQLQPNSVRNASQKETSDLYQLISEHEAASGSD